MARQARESYRAERERRGFDAIAFPEETVQQIAVSITPLLARL